MGMTTRPVLALTALAPISARGWSLHLVTTTALAWLVTRALTVLFFVPIAQSAPGRFRVIPRFPAFGVLSGAMGVALIAYGAWRANDAGLSFYIVGVGVLGLVRLRGTGHGCGPPGPGADRGGPVG